jgi:hypothetical protein
MYEGRDLKSFVVQNNSKLGFLGTQYLFFEALLTTGIATDMPIPTTCQE